MVVLQNNIKNTNSAKAVFLLYNGIVKKQKMLNFEIKTKISDCAKILERIKNIGAVYKETMNQIDYYLQIGTEKEKIREINDTEISLISYKRSETNGRKDSNYKIKPLTLEQKELIIKNNYPVCIVNKTRQLWMYKNTRIHIDNVTGLGNFMELETVVKNISKERGLIEFNEIVDQLEIDLNKAEPFSYSDLILNQISKNEGDAVKKRENVHKMAEVNKAFAHFAW